MPVGRGLGLRGISYLAGNPHVDPTAPPKVRVAGVLSGSTDPGSILTYQPVGWDNVTQTPTWALYAAGVKQPGTENDLSFVAPPHGPVWVEEVAANAAGTVKATSNTITITESEAGAFFYRVGLAGATADPSALDRQVYSEIFADLPPTLVAKAPWLFFAPSYDVVGFRQNLLQDAFHLTTGGLTPNWEARGSTWGGAANQVWGIPYNPSTDGELKAVFVWINALTTNYKPVFGATKSKIEICVAGAQVVHGVKLSQSVPASPYYSGTSGPGPAPPEYPGLFGVSRIDNNTVGLWRGGEMFATQALARDASLENAALQLCGAGGVSSDAKIGAIAGFTTAPTADEVDTLTWILRRAMHRSGALAKVGLTDFYNRGFPDKSSRWVGARRKNLESAGKPWSYGKTEFEERAETRPNDFVVWDVDKNRQREESADSAVNLRNYNQVSPWTGTPVARTSRAATYCIEFTPSLSGALGQWNYHDQTHQTPDNPNEVGSPPFASGHFMNPDGTIDWVVLGMTSPVNPSSTFSNLRMFARGRARPGAKRIFHEVRDLIDGRGLDTSDFIGLTDPAYANSEQPKHSKDGFRGNPANPANYDGDYGKGAGGIFHWRNGRQQIRLRGAATGYVDIQGLFDKGIIYRSNDPVNTTIVRRWLMEEGEGPLDQYVTSPKPIRALDADEMVLDDDYWLNLADLPDTFDRTAPAGTKLATLTWGGYTGGPGPYILDNHNYWVWTPTGPNSADILKAVDVIPADRYNPRIGYNDGSGHPPFVTFTFEAVDPGTGGTPSNALALGAGLLTLQTEGLTLGAPSGADASTLSNALAVGSEPLTLTSENLTLGPPA